MSRLPWSFGTKGSRPNHVLHLILTIITVGLWGIVWIILAVVGEDKGAVIDVDEFGNTNIQR